MGGLRGTLDESVWWEQEKDAGKSSNLNMCPTDSDEYIAKATLDLHKDADTWIRDNTQRLLS